MEVIGQLTAIVENLLKIKTEREERLRDLGSRVSHLWSLLHIPEEKRSAFFSSHHGIGLDVISACESELASLLKMRSEKVVEIVAEIRVRIKQLWKECAVPLHERQRVKVMGLPDCHLDEAALAEHEAALGALQVRFEEMLPLLKLIKRRGEYMVCDSASTNYLLTHCIFL